MSANETRSETDDAVITAARLAAIIASSDDAIVGKDLSGIVTAWNGGAERIFGYSEKEMIGQPITRVIPPERLDEETQILAKIIRGERVGHFDTVRVTKSGQKVDVSVTVSPIRDATGNVVGASKVARDITERKIIEGVRRAAMERVRMVIEAMPNAIIMVDATGTITLVNSQTEKLFGYTRKELLGASVETLIPEGHRTPHIGQRADYFSAPSARMMGVGRDLYGLRKDGAEVPIEIGLNPLRTAEGMFVLASVIDISERKRAQQALLESEQKLRLFIEHAPASLAMFDRDMRYLAVSRRWLIDYSLQGRDVRGQAHYDIFPEISDEWKAIHQRALAGEVIRCEEDRFERRDGATQWLRWEVRPWYAADQTVGGIILFTEEITARKEAETEVRRLNAELESQVAERTVELRDAVSELEAFSYSVSHDLRAPLRHILGYVEMLQRETTDQLSEKARRYLNVVTDAAHEMGALIDDLLSFSRTSRATMRAGRVALDDLVQASIRGLEMATRNRNIEWNIAPLPVVDGDAGLLKLVFTNLIGNAVKYTRPRNPARIEIGCARSDHGRPVIFIRDNGVGFDMQYAHKLFGVFQRLHRADEFEGTGIGLATARRIIARHGGTIRVEAAPNQGATFSFTLGESVTH
jgi:PAS domain S-box-containing protein